jgi:hypothetical protein
LESPHPQPFSAGEKGARIVAGYRGSRGGGGGGLSRWISTKAVTLAGKARRTIHGAVNTPLSNAVIVAVLV